MVFFNICKKTTQNELLANFPVSDLWGVGRQLSKRLSEMGINTALKLRDVDIVWARKHFTVVGERLVRELRGFNCLELEEVMAKKNINVVDANILIMGLTFKENCPDLRNSRVVDLIQEFEDLNCNIDVFDPWVDKKEAQI